MQLISGDIGGTHTRLGLFTLSGGSLHCEKEQAYSSTEYPGLEPCLEAFLEQLGPSRPTAACLAVAGPVTGRKVPTTNLPWVIDADVLARKFGIRKVTLINDIEAVGWGIGELSPEEFRILQRGAENATGHAAVIAAGTGLGQAGLYWNGKSWRPFPSEGGHQDFAPTGELQIELLRFLSRRHDHVSWERLVCGPGLVTIFEFLHDRAGKPAPDWLATRADPASRITTEAHEGSSPLAVETLELFVRLYGAQAGNLALTLLARGGVFIGGGIAPRIEEFLTRPTFIESFLAKGRMRGLLEAIPVKMILNQRVALLGAARRASLGDPPGESRP